MTDFAELVLIADTTQTKSADQQLDKLADTGERTEKRLTAASQRQSTAQRVTNAAVQSSVSAAQQAATATQAHTAAARANVAAQQAQTAAAKSLAYQQRMVAFQLNDVFVSLASGMPPMMVAVQQGSQLSQVQGGLAGAFKMTAQMATNVVTKFPLVTAATIAVGAAFAGLTYEINQTTDVAVGMGDVMLATVQLAAEGIWNTLKPAIDAIAPMFATVWNTVVGIWKDAWNILLGTAAGAYAFIVDEWDNLPAAMGDLVIRAANAYIGGVEKMLNGALDLATKYIKKIESLMNKLPDWAKPEGGFDFGSAGEITLGRIDNPWPDEANKNGGIDSFWEEFNKDRLGNGFDAITERAIKLASATDDAGKKLKGAGEKAKEASTHFLDAASKMKDATNQLLFDANSIGMPKDLATQFAKEQELVNAALKDGKKLTPELTSEIAKLARGYADAEMQMTAAEKAQKTFQDTMDFARDLAGGFVSDLKSGLQQGEGFWKSFGNAAMNVLDKITDKLLGSVLDAIFQVNSAGSGGGGLLGGILNMFTGGIGGGSDPWSGLRLAGGTNYAPAGLAVVGEKGPEIVLMRGGEQVIPNHQIGANNNSRQAANLNMPRASSQNGGGGSIRVEVFTSVDKDGNMETFVQRVSGEVAGQAIAYSAPSIIDQSTKAAGKSLGRGDYDGGMAAYGASRQARTR